MLIQVMECTSSTTSLTDQYKSNPKDQINSKMQQQQQQQQQQQTQQQHHVKRLLSTAAAATGIVGDVDALSGPLQFPQKAERNLWRLEEIRELLNIMQQINALELLNDKTVKSEKVFRNIEQMMHREGFRKKSHSQIWTKWKFLKSTYMTSRRNRIVPKMIPYEIYQILHKMLNSSFGMNAGNSSTASMDGDNSNGDDSILPNPNTDNVKTEQNELAHPIFGFRLGLVKSEPVDTGYETTGNNSVISEIDSLDGTVAHNSLLSPSHSNGHVTQQSLLDIKEERVTDSPAMSSPLLVAPTLTESESTSLLIPINAPSMTITAIPSSVDVTSNKPTTSTSMLPLPPLRIAQFANERNMNEALRRMDTSPPPLAMNPIAITTTQNAVDENGTTFIRKMLRHSGNATGVDISSVENPLNNITTRPSVLRLPKEMTLQLRTTESDTSTTRIAPVAVRQTAYSLRPERSISNISDIMPVTIHHNQTPFLQNNKNATAYHQSMDEPMTSQMASQINAKIKSKSHGHSKQKQKQKKRRLEIPSWNDFKTIHPTKIMRSSLSAVSSDAQHQENESFDENYSELNSSFKKPSKSVPSNANVDPTESPKSPTNKEYTALMEEMLKELGMSLQQTQLEMINKFFETQMEITRREHEYQMRQDQLIMEAFQEQTRQLMNSAKRFLGINVKRSQRNVRNNSRKNHTYQTYHRNGCFEGNMVKENSTVKSGQNARPVDESSSSECMDDDQHNNDNMETAVDPIQFVSSELVEEYDNS